MARTDAGAVLTVEHRRAQMALRAVALRDYLRIWPLWDGTDPGFRRLADATVVLVTAHHKTAAALAAAYYDSFRNAERAGGTAAPHLAATPTEGVIAGTLYLTGRDMTRRAILAGQSPQAARQTALIRTSGTVGRLVLAGGRDTLVESARGDRASHGTRRILSGGACDFCQSLAGQPASDADFQAHDHCGCTAEPVFQ